MWYLHYTIFIQERKDVMKWFMMLLVGLSLPALAGYTYEVQDGDYFIGISLNNNESALITGGGRFKSI